MTLIAIGLLLGCLGLLWVAVIVAINEDRHINRRNLPDARGPVGEKLPDDTKAA